MKNIGFHYENRKKLFIFALGIKFAAQIEFFC